MKASTFRSKAFCSAKNGLPKGLPDFAEAIFFKLESAASQMKFTTSDPDHGISCGTARKRKFAEVRAIAAMIPSVSRAYAGEHAFTIDDIALDDSFGNADSPCDIAIGFFELWAEFFNLRWENSNPPLAPFLDDVDAEITGFQSLHATIGNVAACIGLLKLDRAVEHHEKGDLLDALNSLAWVTLFLQVADGLQTSDIERFFHRAVSSQRASNIAKERHSTSKVGKVKQQVHQWWQQWVIEPKMGGFKSEVQHPGFQ
jgi:hypothetical protein